MAPKGLGAASDDEDDIDNTAKWVQRSRKKQLTAVEKMAKQVETAAEKMAKQLEEQDDDYT
ncbi:hypothetical protein T484DRAFT_1771152 [Baffinella frigidus]|nr:hypothetical protein T484DRAFT_1771152 [Cryptophyta sp. CCMP2293]